MAKETSVRVLVVDDDVRNGAAMRGTLEGLDAEVVVVTSGADALRALLADNFAVVLLDVQMPGMDGFETAELIRRRDRTRDVPIVFVTAIHQADEHVRRGYELGAVDYLFKPFEPAILRQKVRVFVELARARTDAEERAQLLAESEARYRELVDGLPSVVYRRSPGPDVVFVFVSASLERLLGIPPSVWLSRPGAWRETLHPDDRERVASTWSQPVVDDRALRLDYRLVARDGRVRWIEDRAHLVRDPAQGVVAVQGVWTDVTERHELSARLEQSEELLRRTLDAAPVAVFLLDRDAVVQTCNAEATRMFGWSQEELVGRPLRIVPAERRSHLEELLRRALAGDPIEAVDLDACDRNGREIAALLYAAAVRDAGSVPSAAVAIVADITDRRRADLALRRATVDAETSNRELEAFSSAVAHDLRAPLRSIHGFVGILLEEHGRQLDRTGRRLLARIAAAVERMWRLIDDLLALSHCSQMPLVRQTVDLSAIARGILGRLAEASPERVVRTVVADGLVVEGDRQLLQLLMENLLSNAWKFTSHHTRATIEVGRDPETGELFVRDDGAGFDPRFAGDLFVPFHRLHGSEFEGNGIGLATVDRIVRRHGGTVRAEGRVEGGATIYFRVA
jgi:PAS domain S-box-containing protein